MRQTLLTPPVPQLQHQASVGIRVFLSSSQFHVTFITGFTGSQPANRHLFGWNQDKRSKTGRFGLQRWSLSPNWVVLWRKWIPAALGDLDDSPPAVRWEVFSNPTAGGDIDISSINFYLSNQISVKVRGCSALCCKKVDLQH